LIYSFSLVLSRELGYFEQVTNGGVSNQVIQVLIICEDMRTDSHGNQKLPYISLASMIQCYKNRHQS